MARKYSFAVSPLQALASYLEGEVKYSESTTYPVLSENGKITSNETMFDYLIHTAKGDFEVPQGECYPNYTEAAKQFAKAFTHYMG